jgi:hypothetical protein
VVSLFGLISFDGVPEIVLSSNVLERIPVMWKRILHVGNNWSILVR